MYTENRGKMFIDLNSSLHESIFFALFIIVKTFFFCILNILILLGVLPQKIIPNDMIECHHLRQISRSSSTVQSLWLCHTCSVKIKLSGE
jgi:hypothetical protein